MFVDLDWPLNASSLLSASAELLVCKRRSENRTVHAGQVHGNTHCINYYTLYPRWARNGRTDETAFPLRRLPPNGSAFDCSLSSRRNHRTAIKLGRFASLGTDRPCSVLYYLSVGQRLWVGRRTRGRWEERRWKGETGRLRNGLLDSPFAEIVDGWRRETER